jgi:RNA polymerase sigma-70 factor, ECF subfamily
MSDHADQLCERARSGEMTAASELVSLYYERIFAYLRRRCGNDSDAADLTQKTFFKVWVSLSSYQGRSNFSTWLHGIARHVYLDWRRKSNPAGPQTDEWWENREAVASSPFEDAAERDLAGRLFALVEMLDENTRDTIHLHYYQGLSLSETAGVLGIATSTVKYRLREAIGFLRSRVIEQKLGAC